MPNTKELPLPPAPKGHWFWGSGVYLMRNPLVFLEKNIQEYGGIFRITSRLVKLMVVNDPELVRYVLQDNNKNYTKSFGYEIVKLLLGNGLLTSEGDFWRKQRRLSQPAFHRERLALLVKTMVDCTTESIERIQQLPDKNNVDISKQMMSVTLDIVARSMFSSDVKEAIEVVAEEIERSNEYAIARIENPLLPPHWVPTPQNLKERKSIAKLNKVLNDIIEHRRKGNQQYDDLLAMLIEAKDEETGEQMSNLQLRDETMTIFLAGHETTALALAWLWYLLDKNPAQAQKLYDEVDTVLQGRTPTLEDLQKLTYTRMAIDEVLRLYPPGWSIGRRNIEEDVIGGFRVPKRTNILIPIYAIHRDPRIWDEPNEFRPERFMKENMKDKHRFAYFPFGGGPRLCIGNNFALMEMQIVIAMMAQKFRFKMPEGYEPQKAPLITLRIKGNMHGKVEEREVAAMA